MKAKDYAKFWTDMQAKRPTQGQVEPYKDIPPDEAAKPADDVDLVMVLCRKLAEEFKVICETRKATSSEAMAAILFELQEKWVAICRRIDAKVVVPAAFGLYLEVFYGGVGMRDILTAGRAATMAIFDRRQPLFGPKPRRP